jgi:hypothetical protein
MIKILFYIHKFALPHVTLMNSPYSELTGASIEVLITMNAFIPFVNFSPSITTPIFF